MRISQDGDDAHFFRVLTMKPRAPYVLPMSCVLLMSGLGAWYVYSKISVILTISQYEKKASSPTQAPIAIQAGSPSEQSIGRLKGFFGDAKKVLPKAPKEKSNTSIALHGVLAGSAEGKAAAIISLNGDRQRIYYAGDFLTDGLKLVSVQDKEVLVTDADGLRSVRLERTKGGDQGTLPVDRIIQSPSTKEVETKETARMPGSVEQGFSGVQPEIAEKLSRLKSLAHGEQK
ncbi:type II secretion system protein N [Pseudomonas sp. EpS/L25]|uniref:type II secretion system protein N n=1 Tax=Pseudomonas sp. EpS/L25 TaxID=1749078 RepID=UPI001365E571|nr:type II secretion system protein N [Pseudomonas sp. EpS/L25]